MAKTVFQVLHERIEEDKQRAYEHLGAGACKDFAEYRDLCGAIRGLALAQGYIQDLSRNMEENDD